MYTGFTADVIWMKSVQCAHMYFNRNAKFTLIESLTNTNKKATETLKERLKNRESFWIIKLKTLTPNGLNQELN